MAKFSKKLIVVIAIMLLSAMVLVACNNIKFTPIEGGQADRPTESNGGFVVKQGDYIYFLNGKKAYEDIKVKADNTFGKPLKGSICRVKKNSEGVYEDFQVIVPRIAMSKTLEQGFSIFGNWIYYSSPSIGTDKVGTLQTADTDFYRCNISGANTQKIATITGESLKYKFTASGLIYEKDSKINCISYTDSKIAKDVEISKEVTSSIYPVSTNYTIGEVTANDYVYYTKASTDKYANHNIMYAVTGDGVVKTIIDETDKATDAEKFSRTIKSYAEEGKEIALYFEKSVLENGEMKKLGLFGFKFNNTLTYDKTTEKKFATSTETTTIPYKFDKGILVSTSGELYIPTYDEKGIEKSRISYKFPSSTTFNIFDLRFEGENLYLYNLVSDSLIRQELLPNGNVVGNSTVIIETGLATDWYKAERIGNDFFFINSKYLNYMYVADLTKYNASINTGVEASFVGKMTDVDKKAYDKQIEAEKKEEDAGN